MKYLHNELLHYSMQMQKSIVMFDGRISNILIFMHNFFHQRNESFYLHSLIVSACVRVLSMNQVLRKPTCTW